MLLLHRIPASVDHQELSRLFSGRLNAEIQVRDSRKLLSCLFFFFPFLVILMRRILQSELRVRGNVYSTFAVFKCGEDATAAFQALKGQETKVNK